MNHFYLAALVTLALISSVFFHPIVGLVLFAAGVIVPVIPAAAGAAVPWSRRPGQPTTRASQSGGLITALVPYFEASLAALVTALIAWGAQALQKWLGIQLVQSAANLTFDARSAVIAQAIEWVESSVPDALKHVGLTPVQLQALIESKIGAVAAATPAIVAPAPAPAG